MKRATDYMTENSNDDKGSAKAADTEIDLSSPGARLKAERERQGFEQEELATKLRITRHYLRAIEEDAHDRLPGVVFARGYVRNYCLLLKSHISSALQLRVGILWLILVNLRVQSKKNKIDVFDKF